MLEESERPAFILGNGIRLAGGIAEAEAVLRRYEIPVITGWSGMDMIPSDHPRHFGHAGVYGGRCANFLVQNADLLVCVGTRLAIPQVGYDFAEYARAAKKVVVDIDEAELRKFRPAVDLGVCADAKEFLTALLDTGGETLQRPAWMDQCAAWRRRYPILEPEHHISRPDAINTYAFMDAINRHIGKNDTLVADAGAAHTTTQQVAKIRGGQRIIATTGLGEMGYGLPAAVGAAFARPGGRVVLITGDGSMMLNLQELQTIVHHNLPITIFVYDNEGYLTIRNTQNALFKGRQAGSGTDSGVTCPDFLKIGEAFGMKTLTIRELEEAGECIEEAHREPGPVLCVVKCDAKQIFVPKLSLGVTESGEMVSPPLEDLSPLLPRETLAEEMLIGIHPKSVRLAAEPTPAEKVLP
jgi:acetolactate synthase I/II/III large subunit